MFDEDMVHWPIVAYVFPRTYQHPWAVKDFWAPEIHFVDGQFVVYYAARHKDGMLCVGAAIAKNVIGPYTDIGYPLIHNTSVGMIDPHYFKDPVSGLSYLFWKEDANGLHPPRNYTPIWVRQLTPDGLHFVGPQTLVLQNDPMSWEGGLVEAPWVIYLSRKNKHKHEQPKITRIESLSFFLSITFFQKFKHLFLSLCYYFDQNLATTICSIVLMFIILPSMRLVLQDREMF